jgi:hypothetical protein
VTAAKKLFIAAVLLSVGYGVARLMGSPAARWYDPSSDNASVAVNSKANVAKPLDPPTASVSPANDARLVPDFSAENPYRVGNNGASMSAAQQVQINATQGLAAAAPPPHVTQSNYLSPRESFEPRAKLRDEAPRPLDFDSRPPTSFATINASHNEPVDFAPIAPAVAPPPWPEPVESNGPRTHVVVDGDSLERLAGRYLDDSSRANEIYEANRELLASPDLLPIGAELVIPKHTRSATFDTASPQTSLASDGGILRPIPPAGNVSPRAQLLSPRPVD